MRYYHPGIGRFLARDMLSEAVAQSKISPEELLAVGIKLPIHPYTYANNSPSVAVDPIGLQPERDDPNTRMNKLVCVLGWMRRFVKGWHASGGDAGFLLEPGQWLTQDKSVKNPLN